jgi:choline transporter-like protein 2/4/5
MALYMFFGLLWILAFINYCSKFIVMVSVSTYYFNSCPIIEGDAEVLLGFKFAYLNHAGSIAFGSFVIAIVQFIKIIFIYIAR